MKKEVDEEALLITSDDDGNDWPDSDVELLEPAKREIEKNSVRVDLTETAGYRVRQINEARSMLGLPLRAADGSVLKQPLIIGASGRIITRPQNHQFRTNFLNFVKKQRLKTNKQEPGSIAPLNFVKVETQKPVNFIKVKKEDRWSVKCIKQEPESVKVKKQEPVNVKVEKQDGSESVCSDSQNEVPPGELWHSVPDPYQKSELEELASRLATKIKVAQGPAPPKAPPLNICLQLNSLHAQTCELAALARRTEANLQWLTTDGWNRHNQDSYDPYKQWAKRMAEEEARQERQRDLTEIASVLHEEVSKDTHKLHQAISTCAAFMVQAAATSGAVAASSSRTAPGLAPGPGAPSLTQLEQRMAALPLKRRSVSLKDEEPSRSGMERKDEEPSRSGRERKDEEPSRSGRECKVHKEEPSRRSGRERKREKPSRYEGPSRSGKKRRRHKDEETSSSEEGVVW